MIATAKKIQVELTIAEVDAFLEAARMVNLLRDAEILSEGYKVFDRATEKIARAAYPPGRARKRHRSARNPNENPSAEERVKKIQLELTEEEVDAVVAVGRALERGRVAEVLRDDGGVSRYQVWVFEQTAEKVALAAHPPVAPEGGVGGTKTTI